MFSRHATGSGLGWGWSGSARVLLFLPLLAIPGARRIDGSPAARVADDSGATVPALDFTSDRAVRFADIYKFPLRATSRARGAKGAGHLRIAQSPFGIALTADGHLVYDLEVTIEGLRAPRPSGGRGGGTYIAWLTTPELDRFDKLGPVEPSGTFSYRVSTMNKFILLVSLEASEAVTKRAGPTVLRGVSPSGLMQNMESHELFSTMPHD